MSVTVQQTEIGNYGSFFAFLHPSPKNKKTPEFLKNGKSCWRYHHFTNKNQKLQSYEVRFLRYGVRQMIFVIFGNFFSLLPPNNLQNQNFERMKKASGDVIILYIILTIS